MNVCDRLNRVNNWFVQGVNQSREGNHAGAIQAFDQAVQHDSDDAAAWGHRCVARYRMGDKQGAIADCQQAAILYLKQGKAREHHHALKMLSKLQE